MCTGSGSYVEWTLPPVTGRGRIGSVGCELSIRKHVLNVVLEIMCVVEVDVNVEYDVEITCRKIHA